MITPALLQDLQDDPLFLAIWNAIKDWKIVRPGNTDANTACGGDAAVIYLKVKENEQSIQSD